MRAKKIGCAGVIPTDGMPPSSGELNQIGHDMGLRDGGAHGSAAILHKEAAQGPLLYQRADRGVGVVQETGQPGPNQLPIQGFCGKDAGESGRSRTAWGRRSSVPSRSS